MIKLKVPKKPAAESVSIGNFHADLKPGAVIETESRKFADYLVANARCKEVVDDAAADGAAADVAAADAAEATETEDPDPSVSPGNPAETPEIQSEEN